MRQAPELQENLYQALPKKGNWMYFTEEGDCGTTNGSWNMNGDEKKMVIGSDHAGFEMKEYIKGELDKLGIEYEDLGTKTNESTHYPLYAGKVAKAVASGKVKRGIAICGTGIGASMAANRFRGVRAGLCITPEMAELTRQHNDANVLVLGGRITSKEDATKILEAFLKTDFEGGRHQHRVELIDQVNSMNDL